MFEVARLEAAAWALGHQADGLDDTVRRLRARVEQSVAAGHWRGPSADRYRQATQDRYARMRRTGDRMRDLAARFRRQADVLRREEEARRRMALQLR